jgi:ArsR family transcriptional regulator
MANKQDIASIDEQTAERVASLFRSLSDPTRVRIISTLVAGEVNVGDLVQVMGLSKSAISHQLRGLRDKRVVRTRKQGRQVFVYLDDEHIHELFQRGLDHVCHE